MRKLAYNMDAMLVECGNEYWIAARSMDGMRWSTSCINSKSDDYGDKEALSYFTHHHGSALWVHERMKP